MTAVAHRAALTPPGRVHLSVAPVAATIEASTAAPVESPVEPPVEARVEARVETPIEAHMTRLGFVSVAVYRLWCYRNGFDHGLVKDERQRQVEREAAALTSVKRHQTSGRRQLLERLAAGDVDASLLKVNGVRVTHQTIEALGEDLEARRLLLRLLLYVDRFFDVLSGRRIDHGRYPCLASGLAALARHHRSWLRPLEAWQPNSKCMRGQFHALARHLLARYSVPSFMDSVWFEGLDARAL